MAGDLRPRAAGRFALWEVGEGVLPRSLQRQPLGARATPSAREAGCPTPSGERPARTLCHATSQSADPAPSPPFSLHARARHFCLAGRPLRPELDSRCAHRQVPEEEPSGRLLGLPPDGVEPQAVGPGLRQGRGEPLLLPFGVPGALKLFFCHFLLLRSDARSTPTPSPPPLAKRWTTGRARTRPRRSTL